MGGEVGIGHRPSLALARFICRRAKIAFAETVKRGAIKFGLPTDEGDRLRAIRVNVTHVDATGLTGVGRCWAQPIASLDNEHLRAVLGQLPRQRGAASAAAHDYEIR